MFERVIVELSAITFMANWTTARALTGLALTLALACNRRSGELGPSSHLGVRAGPNQEPDVTEQPEVDPIALLRGTVPDFIAPAELVLDLSAIPAGPAELAATSTKPLISGAPLIDETPVLSFGRPFSTVAPEGACERTDYDGDQVIERQHVQAGPHGPVLSWTIAESDERVETVARYTYDSEGRVVKVVLEDRSRPEPCNWMISRQEMGYDDHGGLVRHHEYQWFEPVRYVANDARVYDDDGRIRWIYRYYDHYDLDAVRVSWEGDRVVLVEHFDRSGQWSDALVGTWYGADYVRVDEFSNSGGTTWDRARVFVRRGGVFVEVLLLVGDIDKPTAFRETEYVADLEITRHYKLDGSLSSVTTRLPHHGWTIEKPDEHGELVVSNERRWLEPGVYGTSDGSRRAVYRTSCPDFASSLPSFPKAGECPPVPEGKPIYGPDESDR